MRHHIRLKEQERNRDRPSRPSEVNLQRNNGTLKGAEFEFRTDSNGFIEAGGENDLPPGPSVYFLGGSFVESSFAEPEQRFAARVQQITQRRIINAGYSGTTLLQALGVVVYKLPPLVKEGDRLFLFSSQSDANASRLPGGYWTNNRTYTPIVPPIEDAPGCEFKYSHTATLLDTLATFCKGIGIDLALVVSPYLRIDWDRDEWARLNFGNRRVLADYSERRKGISEQFRLAAVRNDLPVLDLESFIAGDERYF